MRNYFKDVFYGLDLEAQYQGFRTLYFFDLFVALVLVFAGQAAIALFFVVVGLILGNISNSKLLLINQDKVLKKLDQILGNK